MPNEKYFYKDFLPCGSIYFLLDLDLFSFGLIYLLGQMIVGNSKLNLSIAYLILYTEWYHCPYKNWFTDFIKSLGTYLNFFGLIISQFT